MLSRRRFGPSYDHGWSGGLLVRIQLPFEIRDHLVAEHAEHVALLAIERWHHFSRPVDEARQSAVRQRNTVCRQHNQKPTAVGRSRTARDITSRLQTVDLLGYRTGGDQERVKQLGRPQGVGGPGAAKRIQNSHIGAADPEIAATASFIEGIQSTSKALDEKKIEIVR